MKQMLLLFTLILVSPCCAQTQKGNNPKPENCDAVIVQRCDSSSERRSTNSNVFDCCCEVMPSFPGGQDSLRVFIAQNLRWPGTGCECVQGRVICEFIVEKDGTCTNFEVMRSLAPEFDAEALRVLRLMPKWIPGKQRNGVAMRCKYVIPITFRLQ